MSEGTVDIEDMKPKDESQTTDFVLQKDSDEALPKDAVNVCASNEFEREEKRDL